MFLPSFEPGNFHVLGECDNHCGNWTFLGFPGGSDGKESAFNVGDLSLIPVLGRSPGGGHGNPFQYSCPENPHAQRSRVGYSPWGRKELDRTERLSAAYRLGSFSISWRVRHLKGHPGWFRTSGA